MDHLSEVKIASTRGRQQRPAWSAAAVPGAAAALEVRPKRQTDLWCPCTPPHPRKSAPLHRDFPGTPGSRGPASAVLAHPRRVGSLRSSAPDHDLGHLATKSLASLSGQASWRHTHLDPSAPTRAQRSRPAGRLSTPPVKVLRTLAPGPPDRQTAPMLDGGLRVLREVFGLEEFRPGQAPVIE